MSEARRTTRVRGFAPWNPKAATLALLAQVQAVLNEYTDYLPLTCRRAFYRLVGACDPVIDHHCIVRRKYGTRSNDHGNTWSCFEHDPDRKKDTGSHKETVKIAAVSWAPCQACSGAGVLGADPSGMGCRRENNRRKRREDGGDHAG